MASFRYRIFNLTLILYSTQILNDRYACLEQKNIVAGVIKEITYIQGDFLWGGPFCVRSSSQNIRRWFFEKKTYLDYNSLLFLFFIIQTHQLKSFYRMENWRRVNYHIQLKIRRIRTWNYSIAFLFQRSTKIAPRYPMASKKRGCGRGRFSDRWSHDGTWKRRYYNLWPNNASRRHSSFRSYVVHSRSY